MNVGRDQYAHLVSVAAKGKKLVGILLKFKWKTASLLALKGIIISHLVCKDH